MAERKRRPKTSPEEPALISFEAEPDDEADRELFDVPVSDLARGKTDWFWPDRLEWGTVAFIQGEKGAGKSTWLRTIAAHLTGGPSLPYMPRRRRVSTNVLWYAGEESLTARVRPGLEAVGADLSRVFASDTFGPDLQKRLQLPNDCERLERRMRHRGARVAIIDPVFSFSDGTCELEGPTEPARRFMTALARVAASVHGLIILSRNVTKDTSRGALAAGRGGGELGNAARAVLHVQRLPDQIDVYGLATAACNAAKTFRTICYRLRDNDGFPTIEARDLIDLSADDLCSGEEAALDRWQLDKAKALILKVVDGRIDSKVVKAKAEAAMIGVRTLQGAAKALGVQFKREGAREATTVYWLPPKGGWQPPRP